MSYIFFNPNPAPAANKMLKPPSMGTAAGLEGGGGCAEANWLTHTNAERTTQNRMTLFIVFMFNPFKNLT